MMSAWLTSSESWIILSQMKNRVQVTERYFLLAKVQDFAFVWVISTASPEETVNIIDKNFDVSSMCFTKKKKNTDISSSLVWS